MDSNTKTKDTSSTSAPHTPAEPSRTRQFLEDSLIAWLTIIITSALEKRFLSGVDSHYVLYFVIFMVIQALLKLLYKKLRPV